MHYPRIYVESIIVPPSVHLIIRIDANSSHPVCFLTHHFFTLTNFNALNLPVKLRGIVVTAPSGTSPIILAGQPATIEKGGRTISGGTVVPASTWTKSFKIHLQI
jgi:hypothetical protein